MSSAGSVGRLVGLRPSCTRPERAAVTSQERALSGARHWPVRPPDRCVPSREGRSSMTANRPCVTGGVDTHGRSHHAAVIDSAGRVLGAAEFEANATGYLRLLTWMRRHGELAQIGVEGTGTYGAGLTRCLLAEGVPVAKVDRPNRRMRIAPWLQSSRPSATTFPIGPSSPARGVSP